MTDETFLEKREEGISFNIFSVSATMVGVCFTVLGILTIFKKLNKMETVLDESITATAILFLTSCILSYSAIKTKERKRRYRLEKTADAFFLVALFFIVIICILFAFELL